MIWKQNMMKKLLQSKISLFSFYVFLQGITDFFVLHLSVGERWDEGGSGIQVAGKHGHNLASYGEVISFYIFFPSTRHFWHTHCCIPGFILRCFICVSLPLYISCILFRNRAVSELRYSLWSSILVKTKLHLVNYFCLTLRHCGSFLFWGSSPCSARFTPNYREQHFGQIFLVFK